MRLLAILVVALAVTLTTPPNPACLVPVPYHCDPKPTTDGFDK